MKAAQVRSTFLDFFAEKGHERVRSSSLVPGDDPTLLFTNAGMVQFKDVFTGQQKREIPRATSSQKCVRAGGKHNDLDEVGKTPRHQTFFEMLGNFSFGDYFKEDAIVWAWELLTQHYGFDPKHLIVSVFAGDTHLGVPADEEARAIWRRVTGFGDDRILGLGKSENFWMMGETGPMGPCSEIHYSPSAPVPSADAPPKAWDSWLEIWNLVFMQYERKVEGGPLDPLPAPSIDTGAGLERISSVLQGGASNYDTDLFTPLIQEASACAHVAYGGDPDKDMSMRVIADHARATAFLIADGVFPDKTNREYVLRRIFRRAVRHGKLLGIDEPFMFRVCARVVEEMKDVFPELEAQKAVIEEIAKTEEKRFRATLDRGLHLLEDEFEKLAQASEKQVTGPVVFQLYDTFGFPEDLTEIIAEERGFTVDRSGFEAEMDKARILSKKKQAGYDYSASTTFSDLAQVHGASRFTGYDGVSGTGKILALVVDQTSVAEVQVGDLAAVICDSTPFYAEAGGQIGDAGTGRSASGSIRIDDCKKPVGDQYIHYGVVTDGSLQVGDTVELAVDEVRRDRIRANHSGTHLLQRALKTVLGDHVAQKGSLVGPDRLRFDFTHFNPMTAEQKAAVEDWVNQAALANQECTTEVLPVEEAQSRGAIAMFGEKYGSTVRVVNIGSESLEFCGGTHVRRTGDIGLCKILSEGGVAQGVRRIEAVTGAGALAHVQRLETELQAASERLKSTPFEVDAKVAKLQQELRGQDKEIAALKKKLASGGNSRDLMADLQEVDGVRVLATSTEVDDIKTLRETGDQLRDKLGSGVLLLVGIGEDKLSLIAMVTKDLTDRFHAGKLLKSVAEVVDGRGGGRPDMAQGGGKDVTKVPDALARALEYVGSVTRS